MQRGHFRKRRLKLRRKIFRSVFGMLFCCLLMTPPERAWATSPISPQGAVALAYKQGDFSKAREIASHYFKHWEYVDVYEKGKLDKWVNWMTFVFSARGQYRMVKLCEANEHENDLELMAIYDAYRLSMRHMFTLWATIPIEPPINQTASRLEDTYDYKMAASHVSEILGKEIALLEKNGRYEKAEALRKENAPFLNLPKPSYDPKGPEIVRDSSANPGPLQQIDACYRMGMTPEARQLALELFHRYRQEALEAGRQKKPSPEAALSPIQMASQAVSMLGWEELPYGREDGMSKAYFPKKALPFAEQLIGLTDETMDILASVHSNDETWKSNIRKSQNHVALMMDGRLARLRKFAGRPDPRRYWRPPPKYWNWIAMGLASAGGAALLWLVFRQWKKRTTEI